MTNLDDVIVIGADIAGLASAILLARDNGLNVTVFESERDIVSPTERPARPRENYRMNAESLAVLDLINPTLRSKVEVGSQEFKGAAVNTANHTVRDILISALYLEAKDIMETGPKLNFRYSMRLTNFDVVTRTLLFQDEHGQEVRIDASSSRILDSHTMLRSGIGQIAFFGHVCEAALPSWQDGCIANIEDVNALVASLAAARSSEQSWFDTYNKSCSLGGFNSPGKNQSLCFEKKQGFGSASARDNKNRERGMRQVLLGWLSVVCPALGNCLPLAEVPISAKELLTTKEKPIPELDESMSDAWQGA